MSPARLTELAKRTGKQNRPLRGLRRPDRHTCPVIGHLHVAIAIAEQADPFITADRRQRDVALREGLVTEMLE